MKATLFWRTPIVIKFSFETLQLHAGQAPDKAKSRVLFQFEHFICFDDAQEGEDLFALKPGNIYTYYQSNSSERRIAALERWCWDLAASEYGCNHLCYHVWHMLAIAFVATDNHSMVGHSIS